MNQHEQNINSDYAEYERNIATEATPNLSYNDYENARIRRVNMQKIHDNWLLMDTMQSDADKLPLQIENMRLGREMFNHQGSQGGTKHKRKTRKTRKTRKNKIRKRKSSTKSKKRR